MYKELYSKEMNDEQQFLMQIYDAYEEEYKQLDKQVLEIFKLMKSRKKSCSSIMRWVEDKFKRKMEVEELMLKIENQMFISIQNNEFLSENVEVG
ncbi:hypothetical protein [Brevibacillus borstelensis]|uniref:hypothetical protein n=1 Tax=Brevibacillus borstelensis TaxID=45462 RepID=UPI0020416AB7|nr:hypothetical protein [Brevibacillus borstelensis]MCM3473626.1 hypothetical protein [Brevibacillus borstelensis]MED1854468.1 hypothetical protein [Brevibacillus borstelensis]